MYNICNMALLKCPECGHKVSEYADFCIGCGCNISYIKQYYKNIEREKAVAKEREKEAKRPDFYLTLSQKQKELIDTIKSDLEKNSIKYFFDNSKDYVGLRKNKDDKLIFYLSNDKDKNLIIHLYSLKNGKNAFAVFDNSKIKDYIAYIEHILFSIPRQAVVSKKTDEEFDESKLKKYRSKYTYSIRDNQVCFVRIEKIVKTKEKFRVYFTYWDGTKKFCLLDNIDNILYKSALEANKHITKPKAINYKIYKDDYKPEPVKAYVVKEVFSDTYFSGFHKIRQYDSEGRSGYDMYGPYAFSGAYIVLDVPDFVLNVNKAEHFFTKESAEKLIKKIQSVSGTLEVVEHMYTPK